MRKIAMIGAAAMMAMALAGCKSGGCCKSGSMGSTSGQCEKNCSKASMGTVSGECSKAKTCTTGSGAMGTVSGECSKAKSACTKSGAMGTVSGECSKAKTCTKSVN